MIPNFATVQSLDPKPWWHDGTTGRHQQTSWVGQQVANEFQCR